MRARSIASLLAILEKTSPTLVVFGIVNCELGASAFGLLNIEKSAVCFLCTFGSKASRLQRLLFTLSCIERAEIHVGLHF